MAGAAVGGRVPLLLVAGGEREAREAVVAALGGTHEADLCGTAEEAARRAAAVTAVVVHLGPLPRGSALARPAPRLRTIVAGGPAPDNPWVRHVADPVDAALLRQAVTEARDELATAGESAPPQQRAAPPVRLHWLGPPFLPPSLEPKVPIATSAGRAAVPVTITGDPGSGRARLARDLHRAARGPGAPITTIDGRDETALCASLSAGPQPPPTLVIAAAERMSLAAQHRLLDALDRPRAERPWVIALCGDDPRAHAARGEMTPVLATRLTSVVLRLPALAMRRHEVPQLAAALLEEIGEGLGRALTLAPRAADRLASHLWPGGIAELEAVLERTALASPRDEIAAEELWLDPQALPATAPSQPPPPPPASEHLELLLAELAHELKNPLVTVKTFAAHLPDLLADAALRERFASLTEEAIRRMDDLLDNVLCYARLGTPEPRPVELEAVLERALSSVGPELQARGLEVRREGPPTSAYCLADEAHLEYALRNLLRGLVPELAGEREVRLATGLNGSLAVRFHAGAGVANKLRSLVGVAPQHSGGLPALPLGMSLARAVIARNGGRLRVRDVAGGETEVVMELPPVAVEPGGTALS